MKIAVLGCGAIGSLFLGYLTKAGEDVVGVVRDYQDQALSQEGLIISKNGTEEAIPVKTATKLTEAIDLAIFASKIDDLKPMIEDNLAYLKSAVVLSTQNGVRADYILGDYFSLDKIITSIVMFGSTFYAPNKVVVNFPGNLILGSIFNQTISNFDSVSQSLKKAFDLYNLSAIKGAKYLKLLINLNNCIPACLNRSMQETFSDLALAGLAIKLNREAYEVINKAGIKLVSLPAYPQERIENLVSLDLAQAAGIFSKVMSSLSKEPLYGSILQSLKRNKRSEINYINGEVVSLAQENNLKAPLNQKIVELIHGVEDSGKFLSKEELLKAMEVG